MTYKHSAVASCRMLGGQEVTVPSGTGIWNHRNVSVDGNQVKLARNGGESGMVTSIAFLSLLLALFCLNTAGCGDRENDTAGPGEGVNYRQEMRDFVGEIGDYARSFDPSFIIIPQNGQELITGNGEEDGSPVISYLDAIDGVGREDLFYGYDGDNIPTPTFDRDYMISFLDIAEDNHVEVLVIDYCWTQSYVDDSYSQNSARGYISFAADHRELDNIPSYPEAPYKANSSDISSLSSAQNFLYLINPGQFSDRGSFLSALEGTDFDLLIIDLFFNGQELTSTDVAALKRKDNGAARLVIAYMSIGEAEDYRYYWNPEWEVSPPDWLDEENPYWPGNYKVRYWEPDWQDIIFGNNDSYCKKIIDSGFNGAYLDIIDAFEYFENR